jgi:CO/xanthine dehydrogenase Mo-binding subunit
MPNMAHMKILFARRPHAIVKAIDTSVAAQAPGVIAIFTAKDVPNNEYGLIMPDQPVLVGPDSTKKWGDHVRFVGDQIALVVAETEKQAEHARDLIEVEYKELPVVTDPREAMKAHAAQLHPDNAGNLLQHYRIRKGDVDEMWDKCAAIVVGEYQTPFQEHAYLQPEAGLAYIDAEGRVSGHTKIKNRSRTHCNSHSIRSA